MNAKGQSAVCWFGVQQLTSGSGAGTEGDKVELPHEERNGLICRVENVPNQGRLRGQLLLLPLRQDDFHDGMASVKSATGQMSQVGLFTPDESGALVLWLMRRFSEYRGAVWVKQVEFASMPSYPSVGVGVDSRGSFYKLTEGDGYDLPFQVAIVPPKLAINWYNPLPDEPCAFCNEPCDYGVGPRLVLEGSAAVICRGCGTRYGPELVYMIDAWQPVQASDGRDGSSDSDGHRQ